jgi:hypothetical protein
VSGKEHTDGQSSSRAQVKDGDANVMSVTVVLSGEQAAAVEGWRMAHRMDSQAEAVRELVRIGLLSEIGRIYRMIAGGRGSDESVDMHDVTG